MGFLYSQLWLKPAYPERSFAGETVIITGSNTGLGKEAARHITRLGASKVIIACRNTFAGEEARRDILSTNPNVDPSVIEVWQLDLSSYDSVKAFAKRATDQLSRIDVLLENAGIAASEFSLMEGHESTVTVNVISTFLLAFLLVPKLKDTAKKYNVSPRLTIVTSEVHKRTTFPERENADVFKAISDRSKADMATRYPLSKLLEVLVVRQIAPKFKSSGVTLNMLNPGFCRSSLARSAPFPQNVVFFVMKTLLARTTEVGSRTLVAGAAGSEESHGMYMTDAVVNDEDLSEFVKSEEGDKTGKRVWEELKSILEDIQGGVTGNL